MSSADTVTADCARSEHLRDLNAHDMRESGETPHDDQRTTGTDRSAAARPPTTPAQGLLLAGQWTRPAPGMFLRRRVRIHAARLALDAPTAAPPPTARIDRLAPHRAIAP